MSDDNEKILVNGEEVTEELEITKIEPYTLDDQTIAEIKQARETREIALNRSARRKLNSKKVVKATVDKMSVYDMVQEQTWLQCVTFKHDVGQFVGGEHEDAVSEWLATNANGEFILNHLTKEVGFRKQEVNDAFEQFIASL